MKSTSLVAAAALTPPRRPVPVERLLRGRAVTGYITD
jgi:hypothetical protein